MGSKADQLWVANWAVNPEGRPIHADPHWRQFAGQTSEEARKAWLDAIHPDDRSSVEAVWTQTFQSRQPYRLECRLRRFDGVYRRMLAVAAPHVEENGHFHGYIGSLVDIEERRATQQALRDSEERFWALVRCSAQAVWEADAEGLPAKDHPAWGEFAGHANGEGQGFAWLDAIHPDDRDEAEKKWREAVASRMVYQAEFRLKKGDAWRWTSAHGTPLFDDEGSIRKWVVVNIDIDARKMAQEALREIERRMPAARERAEDAPGESEAEPPEAARRKEEFIAMLAHELRNPLAPIHNGVHLLKAAAQKRGDSSDRPLLGIMERQVGRLMRLVDDLLESARLAGGEMGRPNEPTNFGTALRRALETSRPFIEASHICGDPTPLPQAFANLLNDAAKYTPSGSRFGIEVERRDGEAVVTVRDNGRVVAPEGLPPLFELLALIGRAAREDAPSASLALVRDLVETQGGAVEARTAGLGEGGECVLRLPLLTDAASAPRGLLAPAAPMARKRALVIDDDRDVADTLALLLESLGATVRVAYCGGAGAEEARRFLPDIVFLDLGMPGQDGFQTASMIRSAEKGRKLTLVALTGWGQEEDRKRTRQAGFDAHLTKPASIEALRALLGG